MTDSATRGTAACNCDASGDPPTGHRSWCGTEPGFAAGCYICRPDDPTASPEGCAACDARSDAYHRLAAAAIPPGTPSPKVTVEVWDGEDQIDAEVADVVRINDTWHVVVTVDGT